MKLRKIFASIVIFLLFLSPSPGVSKTVRGKKTLLITKAEYFPSDIEESLKKAFERMLFTRLSPYFAVFEGEPGGDKKWDYSLEISLTRIGEGISIDTALKDIGGKITRGYLTGKTSGEIPILLEELSGKMELLAYGKRLSSKPKGKRTGATPKKEKERDSSSLAKYLPKGKLKFSSSFGGGYFRFSGGDVNRDGRDEIVAVNAEGITVIEIREEALSMLYTYKLGKGEKVLFLSCGDINRDRKAEIVATIMGENGVRGLVIHFDSEEEKFNPIEVPDIFLRLYDDRDMGTVLITQKIASTGKTTGKIVFNMLEEDRIKKVKSINVEEGLSLEKITPVWFGGKYHILEYGRAGITLRGEENVTYELDGIVDDIRSVDLDRDGNQEIVLFLSIVENSYYFESLPVKRGFAVEIYRVSNKGFVRDYRFENGVLSAGGFFPKFSARGTVEEFVVIALQGNDFFSPSIKWKEVRIH